MDQEKEAMGISLDHLIQFSENLIITFAKGLGPFAKRREGGKREKEEEKPQIGISTP